MSAEQISAAGQAIALVLTAFAALVTALRVLPKLDKTQKLVGKQAGKLRELTAKESFLRGVREGVAAKQLEDT